MSSGELPPGSYIQKSSDVITDHMSVDQIEPYERNNVLSKRNLHHKDDSSIKKIHPNDPRRI